MGLGHTAITAKEARERVEIQRWQNLRANQYITDAIAKRKTSVSFRFTTKSWFNLPVRFQQRVNINVTQNVNKSVEYLVKTAKRLGYKTRVYKLEHWTRVRLSWS